MAWDPTSKYLAFTRTDEPESLYLIDISTKTVTLLKKFALPLSMLKWSTKGNILTFGACVYPGMSMEETKNFDDQKAETYPSDAIVFDHPPIYRWDSFFTVCLLLLSHFFIIFFILFFFKFIPSPPSSTSQGTYRHIFFTRVKSTENGYELSDPTDIMLHYAGDCPAMPQGSSAEYSISPDEAFIAYTTQPGEIQPWSVRTHIYLYPIPAETQNTSNNNKNQSNNDNDDDTTPSSLPALCITCGRTGHHTAPTFSPDSRKLAFLGTTSDIDESEPPKVLIHDLATRETRTLAAQWDESPSALLWSPHMQDYIILTATKRARSVFFLFLYFFIC